MLSFIRISIKIAILITVSHSPPLSFPLSENRAVITKPLPPIQMKYCLRHSGGCRWFSKYKFAVVNLSCPVLTRTLLTNGAFSINSFATAKNVNTDEFLAAGFLINDGRRKSDWEPEANHQFCGRFCENPREGRLFCKNSVSVHSSRAVAFLAVSLSIITVHKK